MLPEIGATELLVLAAVALIVVGPKDLPMLLRKLGQFVARLRGMAAEIRSSFDDMARQSELEDLRKEVAAMRDSATAESGQVTSALTDINKSLHDDIPPDLRGGPTEAEPYDPNYQLYGEEVEPVLTPADVAPKPPPKAAKPKTKTTISKVAPPKTEVAQAAAPKTPAKPRKPAKPRAPKASA